MSDVRIGRMEVIVGPMFCGKTEEMIRRIKRAKIAKLSTVAFKPDIDKRYDDGSQITSHSRLGVSAISIPVNNPWEIMNHLPSDVHVVGIDEVQFFPESIVDVCQKLTSLGIRVIVSGLDMDYTGKPFGHVPELLAIAERINKLTAICTVCGANATRTQYLLESGSGQIDVGSTDKYTARCRQHHSIPKKN